MLKYITTIIFIFSICHVYAQRIVELSTREADRGGGYEIVADNNSLRNYAILIDFTSHQGLTIPGGMPYLYDAPPGRSSLVVLNAVGVLSRSTLTYNYTIYPGCARTKVKTDINYLMPVAPGMSTEYKTVDYVNERFGDEEKPENWNGAMFTMEKGDRVYAMRRGKVIQYSASRATTENENLIFARDNNYLLIQHEDCTIARYSSLAEDGVQVVEGDYVEAGDPLAIADGSDFASGPHVVITVYYLDRNKLANPSHDSSPFSYLPLSFVTSEGKSVELENDQSYTSAHPEDAIYQEMSKKDIKRYLKRQEN